MRGTDSQQDTLFSTVIPELRPPRSSLRPIREMVNTALKEPDEDSMPCIRIRVGIRFPRRSC